MTTISKGNRENTKGRLMMFGARFVVYFILIFLSWMVFADDKMTSSKIIGCLLGACMGSYLHLNAEGIDFSATAFFLVVVVNQWMQAKSKLPALCGLVSALVFLLFLGPDRFLIPALSFSTLILMLLRDRIQKEEAAV